MYNIKIFCIGANKIDSDYNLNFKINTNKLFYVSGRVAIKTILKKLIQKNDKCLIPNYLCDSIYKCFDKFDYYVIDNNLNIYYKLFWLY